MNSIALHLLIDRQVGVEVNIRNMLIVLVQGLWHRVSPCKVGPRVTHDDVTMPMPIESNR